jgi:putative ATP-grasp target RiPP
MTLGTLMTTVDDPITASGDLFPLGRAGEAIDVDEAAPSRNDVRPFGLRFASDAKSIKVNLTGIVYDPILQLNTDANGSMAGRHTDGKTKTKTGDSQGGPDSDTDHRED